MPYRHSHINNGSSPLTKASNLRSRSNTIGLEAIPTGSQHVVTLNAQDRPQLEIRRRPTALRLDTTNLAPVPTEPRNNTPLSPPKSSTLLPHVRSPQSRLETRIERPTEGGVLDAEGKKTDYIGSYDGIHRATPINSVQMLSRGEFDRSPYAAEQRGSTLIEDVVDPGKIAVADPAPISNVHTRPPPPSSHKLKHAISASSPLSTTPI